MQTAQELRALATRVRMSGPHDTKNCVFNARDDIETLAGAVETLANRLDADRAQKGRG